MKRLPDVDLTNRLNLSTFLISNLMLALVLSWHTLDCEGDLCTECKGRDMMNGWGSLGQRLGPKYAFDDV